MARPVSDFGKGATVAPFVAIIEMPRKYSMPASVTMKEETPMRVTQNPCQAPMSRPPQTDATMATNGFTSCLTVRRARMTPTSATAEPTDRSKLRVTISITALIAARLTIDVCSARRTRLRCVRNVPSVAKYRTIHTPASTSSSIESRSAEDRATRRRMFSRPRSSPGEAEIDNLPALLSHRPPSATALFRSAPPRSARRHCARAASRRPGHKCRRAPRRPSRQRGSPGRLGSDRTRCA